MLIKFRDNSANEWRPLLSFFSECRRGSQLEIVECEFEHSIDWNGGDTLVFDCPIATIATSETSASWLQLKVGRIPYPIHLPEHRPHLSNQAAAQ